MFTSSEKWLVEALIEAENHQEFLAKAFSYLRESNPYFSFAGFAKKAGVQARSFPREVALGKRRLSAESAEKFAKALHFSGYAARYFKTLVERDIGKGNTQTVRTLESLKLKICQQLATPMTVSDEDVYKIDGWEIIYAALGEIEVGATLIEVVNRTSRSEKSCLDILEKLCTLELVTYEEASKRFIAKQNHLVFQKLNSRSNYFRQFSRLLKTTAENSKIHFDSNDNLYFSSHFSVDAQKLPLFKESLRKVLLEFTEQSENPNGTRVSSLVCTFGPSHI